MKTRPAVLVLSILIASGLLPEVAASQSPAFESDTSHDAAITALLPSAPEYVAPTQRTMVRNYVFDAFGPYPVGIAAFAAGINQLDNSPPEWKQGAEGYGKRFGSDFGMAAVTSTTRYALAELLREDTMYYRCECTGIVPRTRHAMISTLTGRRGPYGRRVFSFAALLSPYAGSTTAVYGWYPGRYGAKDALRMGSYNLLIYVGGNIGFEFFYSGPHSMLSRMHLSSQHGSPDPGPNH